MMSHHDRERLEDLSREVHKFRVQLEEIAKSEQALHRLVSNLIAEKDK